METTAKRGERERQSDRRDHTKEEEKKKKKKGAEPKTVVFSFIVFLDIWNRAVGYDSILIFLCISLLFKLY